MGDMIEEKLDAAGVELATGYRLMMLDMPGVEIGDLTVDVTNGGRLFKRGPSRQLLCAVGMPFVSGRPLERAAVEEAIENRTIQSGRVRLRSFSVNLKKSTLSIGGVRPNPIVFCACHKCGRTYHKDQLRIRYEGHKFYCSHCLRQAKKEYEGLSNRERKRRGYRKAPMSSMFRLDRDRNFVRFEHPKLTKRQIDEIVTAAAIPPQDGGVISLPRPFVMFDPGTAKTVWEPASDDLPGQQLKERCARVRRGSIVGQQPVPLEMVIDAYAPKNWDPSPWVKKKPLKVPGMIGVQLLVDHRLAGWVPLDEIKPDVNRHGWWREFPEYSVVRDEASAREV